MSGQRALEHRGRGAPAAKRGRRCRAGCSAGRWTPARRAGAASQSRISLSGARSPGKSASAACSSPQGAPSSRAAAAERARRVRRLPAASIHTRRRSSGRRRQDVARARGHVGPLGQEGTDGHLAGQPLLGVIVQDRRPGDAPARQPVRAQMHQHVAARRNPRLRRRRPRRARGRQRAAAAAASAEASPALRSVAHRVEALRSPASAAR